MVLANDAIRSIARRIYGATAAEAAVKRISTLLDRFEAPGAPPKRRFTEADVVLITYGDSLRSDGRSPLDTFHHFAGRYLKESFSAVHFLPFVTYNSRTSIIFSSTSRLW